jgi:hypothetical protein
MPFVIQDHAGIPLPLHKKMPCSIRFQPFSANLHSSASVQQFQQHLSDNPFFVEAASRIRLLHEFSLDQDSQIHQEAKLSALAKVSKKDSVSQLLLDMMVLWEKKMLKVKSLSQIMESCTQEMGSKLVCTPSASSNPISAETPYSKQHLRIFQLDTCNAFALALQQKMASLEETMKRKLGGELLSIQVQMAEKRRRMNFSQEAVEILKRWFSANSLKPYPSEEEKEQLASQAGITVNQVTNWFINMRKRNWDPAA